MDRLVRDYAQLEGFNHPPILQTWGVSDSPLGGYPGLHVQRTDPQVTPPNPANLPFVESNFELKSAEPRFTHCSPTVGRVVDDAFYRAFIHLTSQPPDPVPSARLGDYCASGPRP